MNFELHLVNTQGQEDVCKVDIPCFQMYSCLTLVYAYHRKKDLHLDLERYVLCVRKWYEVLLWV